MKPQAVSVRYADAEPNGLAEMLGGVIEGNLERDPGRLALLKPALVGVTAVDAGVSASVQIRARRVEIANGLRAGLDVHVAAPSTDLVQLTNVSLRLGLPDPATPGGRSAIVSLASRRIRVSGMLRRPGVLARFNRLLSVR